MINFKMSRELQDLKWNSVNLLSKLERFCSLGMNDSMHEHMKGADWLENSLAKQPLGSWWTAAWTWLRDAHWWQGKRTTTWTVLGTVLSAGQGRWPFPSLYLWWGHTSSSVSSSVLLNTRDMNILDRDQWRPTRTNRGIEHFSYEGRLRELGLFCLVLAKKSS